MTNQLGMGLRLAIAALSPMDGDIGDHAKRENQVTASIARGAPMPASPKKLLNQIEQQALHSGQTSLANPNIGQR